MNRRTLTSLIAAVATLFAASAPSLGKSPAGSRRAAANPVDVSRLEALGLGPIAASIQAAIVRDLAAAGGGGRIAVTITGLSMAMWGGQDDGIGAGGGRGGSGGGGNGNSDFLEGDIRVIGPGGQIVASRHTVVSSPASSGGPYYIPGSDQRRIDALSRSFAQWAIRLL